MSLKNQSLILFFIIAINALPLCSQTVKKLSEIPIRDPYIMPDKKSGYYYMYKSASVNTSGKVMGGVEAYKSRDLKNWEGPVQVFTVPDDNWITGAVWAPEVHAYNGKYYLFATLNSNIQWKKEQQGWPRYLFRGTQIFVSDHPDGPFRPFAKVPHTPMDQMALDGTLWVEEGRPYMIYCHEWVQVIDGAMVLVELAADLSVPAGDPLTLFHASAAGWSTGSSHDNIPVKSYVTDGCFLYRTKTGKLLMIWSSFMNGEYAIGIAESVTGKIHGPWVQQEKPLFTQNGGHGMIFRTFEGRLCMTFHRPNSPRGQERARIFELQDTGDTLQLLQELTL